MMQIYKDHLKFVVELFMHDLKETAASYPKMKRFMARVRRIYEENTWNDKVCINLSYSLHKFDLEEYHCLSELLFTITRIITRSTISVHESLDDQLYQAAIKSLHPTEALATLQQYKNENVAFWKLFFSTFTEVVTDAKLKCKANIFQIYHFVFCGQYVYFWVPSRFIDEQEFINNARLRALVFLQLEAAFHWKFTFHSQWSKTAGEVPAYLLDGSQHDFNIIINRIMQEVLLSQLDPAIQASAREIIS